MLNRMCGVRFLRNFCTVNVVVSCACVFMCMCLCYSPPANSNSSVASEQEERGSLKTQIQQLHNITVLFIPEPPRDTNTLPLHRHLLPPSPAGRAHPSSSPPPIATAHLSSPLLFPDHHTASLLHFPPPLSAPLVPATSSFLSSNTSFAYSHIQASLQTLLYMQQDYEPRILTRL